MHITNKIDGSFRAVINLKDILKNISSSNVYGKLGLPKGLANTKLEYNAFLLIKTCTENITVIQLCIF